MNDKRYRKTDAEIPSRAMPMQIKYSIQMTIDHMIELYIALITSNYRVFY